MSDFEEKALENPETKITLAGQEFIFCEPCKRDCTIWFARSLKIAQKHGIVITEASPNIPILEFIEAIPDILDYLFGFLKVSLKEQERINNEFEIENIMECFNAVVERVTSPFLTGKPSEQEPGTQEEFPTN